MVEPYLTAGDYNMTYAFYGSYWNQKSAESKHDPGTQDCSFVSPQYREAYGFKHVQIL
jgi:hypothetical protein